MNFKHKKLIIALEIIFLVVFFWWFGTFRIKINSITIASDKIKDKITIVHITDLHGSSFGKNNEKLIKKIDEQKPNIIVATGDMYSAGDEKGKQVAFQLLTELAKSYPTYFVNGEHDSNESFMENLKAHNVKVLDYQDEIITIGNTNLHFYGISNVYYSPTFNLNHEFTLDPENYSILLAHIANLPAFEKFGVDLALCGDTHGGQVRLPFLGAIYTQDSWFPDLQGKPMKGLYSQNNTNLFISCGLGNYPIPIRIFNRPEIAVIQLIPSVSK